MKKFLPLFLIMTLVFGLVLVGCSSKKADEGDKTNVPAKSPDRPTESSIPTTTTESGLQIQDLVEGTGATAETGKTVAMHYTGWLLDGTKFDNSIDRGKPYTITLGAHKVIKGWEEGIVGMKVGGERKLTIPPELAYGEAGRGPIPPNSTLVFELYLMSVK
jgi:peptidylprolyl isomerase/FKBP-type peptidyl-prolyl cis-trans isomerase FkpA